MKKKQVFVDTSIFLLFVLFMYTGVTKLIDYETFKFDMWRSSVATNLTPILAIVVPVIEILTASSLLFDRTKKWGLYCSLVLMILFTLYVGLILSTAKSVPCTCGGVLREMSWTQHFWFNIFFTILAGLALFFQSRTSNIKAGRYNVDHMQFEKL